MSTTKRVACAQMCVGADLTENLEQCKSLSNEAAKQGAELLLLPECFPFLGERERDKFQVAEIIEPEKPGPILRELMAMAQRNNLWIIAGGMPEIHPSSPTHTYNTAVVVDGRGKLQRIYRKIHLFDVDIPGGATLKESDATAPGEELEVVDTPVGNVGLSICYDLRFPELYRRLSCEMGAEILVVPAAFTAHTGKAHWHPLLRARAIENQAYVLAAGQAGRHNAKRESYGHSLVVDPWGKIIAELPSGTGIITAEIDRKALEKTRTQMPCLTHRRL